MQYRPVDWGDLRYVLAVARNGSALRAAQVLGVNQTTILRRLEALEAQLGLPLFERRRSGHTLTQGGKLVVAVAERVERETQDLLHALSAQRRTLSGSVRLTTSESLAARLIAPCLRSFRERHPDVTVELVVADERLDVARGEADIALRASSRPEGAGIVARRLPDTHWTIYCAASYAAEKGMPAGREDISRFDIVGMEGRMAQLEGWRWLAAAAGDAPIRCRSNSLTNLVSNLKSGLGLGALPTIVGDAEPDLVRCFPPPPELSSEMWLIVREEVRSHAHIRALADHLAAYVRDIIDAADVKVTADSPAAQTAQS
jgi:DNA-binding transcriptional LysR family regulator